MKKLKRPNRTFCLSIIGFVFAFSAQHLAAQTHSSDSPAEQLQKESSACSYGKDYGLTEKNPIKLGGVLQGPARERAFLQNLLGPQGEEIRFERSKSCCPFTTPHGPVHQTGLLDVYETKINNQPYKKLYFNMYDEAQLCVPEGFQWKGEKNTP
ncbi:MAG: hypothetical protein KDK50_06320 [Chlamydiia bacterium]|nr:hypothetical protein [Chlamydiia bacterium]